MKNYTIENKEGFIVLGIGTELKSDYMDPQSINQEKLDFWTSVHQDGRLDTLKTFAINDYIFSVNEAVNNKMMYYAGVMIASSATIPELEASRIIQFPKGEYVIVKGEEKTADELHNKLTGIAFGQALPDAKEVSYVGGPNTMVEMGQRNGLVFGEMWIPVVRN